MILSKLTALMLCLLFPIAAIGAQETTDADGTAKDDSVTPPTWLAEHMAWMVDHSPLRANNEAYRSDDEPFDAYYTEWSYGPGKHSLVGRLYGVRGSCPTADFWSFRLFWDPVNSRVHSDQLGLSGAYGVGTMSFEGDDRWITEQTFSVAGGATWEDRHEIGHRDDTQTTHSFNKNGDEWVAGRRYAWSGPAEKPKCN